MTGPIPDSIGNLTKLTYLCLYVSDPIPSSLAFALWFPRRIRGCLRVAAVAYMDVSLSLITMHIIGELDDGYHTT